MSNKAKKSKTGDEDGNLDHSNQEADLDSTIHEMEMCQVELETLDEKQNKEEIEIQKKYKKLRDLCYEKSSKFSEKIPDFWFTVFTRHPQLYDILTEQEKDCLHYLRKVEVDDTYDYTGYTLKFHFRKNPYFKNEVLSKHIFYTEDDKMGSDSTKIEWIKSQKKTAAKRAGKKRAHKETQQSFFEWFSNNDDLDGDEIAEIIRHDLYTKSVEYYFFKADVESEDDSKERSDGEERCETLSD